jgi:hypothetical protein
LACLLFFDNSPALLNGLPPLQTILTPDSCP